MSMATPIPLEQLCRLALVSRAGFYRWWNGSEAIDRDLDLRDEIQRIGLEFPFYGWPRITRELGDRGWRVNHKRVYRNLREDNLLCLRRGKFSVMTTNSNHDQPVYPNLAKAITPTGINQLWVADIKCGKELRIWPWREFNPPVRIRCLLQVRHSTGLLFAR
jgi:putative transposase